MQISQIKPNIQHMYVKLMMEVIGRGLVTASQIDHEIQKEIQGFPTGFIFAMKVFPHGPSFKIKVLDNKQLQLIDDTTKPHLSIIFKHIYHAYLVFSFQESTARAFANDRMVADGDLSYAIRLVRCLNKMEALILPKPIATLAVKNYPEQLKLKEKINHASRIYIKIAQSFLKRS
ncbi:MULTISPECIES: hypothetical protein [Acinetobacter]|jgi:hypothetical protein|uniref:SCP2 domain-containing protein n=1 Tax=Acinetobacter pollinis TaxID=2605270 RepID=A0ABU6DQ84_9GAMM|nr:MULTISPECIES: hypothetical protein [Acinetobacter]MBF7690794.1 hypothetical protein [Acinetobacter pollinis]MBF7692605.1 hypothetical protein [Acinetobacter pollinis]MBF7698414.1 hypothetical protein [Acinetobacter pollinis]MBF7699579.1 hypothetical protein [Acinetobacter pollinis]MEB5475817.1 hypothetical protein [Acinetobacter pollinis]